MRRHRSSPPAVYVITSAGSRVRLDQILGDGFALLAFTENPAAAVAAPARADTILLLRPDHHVVAIFRPTWMAATAAAVQALPEATSAAGPGMTPAATAMQRSQP